MKLTVTFESPEHDAESVVVADFKRTGPLNAASFGLTLSEAKALLSEVQRHLAQAQLAAHVAAQSDG